MLHCVRRLMREGPCALWKGSGTVLLGCIPAHATYFSIYESLKLYLGAATRQPDHPLCSSVAVAVSAVAHDSIMTPMDVMKQRLQLGYHSGVLDCARHIWRTEGVRAFYMSFGVTLLMNVPYAAVMGGSNELLRQLLTPPGADATTSTFLLAGAGSGVVAAALTNPLDVVKTRLQTQHCATISEKPASTGGLGVARGGVGCIGAPPLGSLAARPMGTLVRYLPTAAGSSAGLASAHGAVRPLYTSLVQTVRRIHAEEGLRGFIRGIGPRALYHAPSVAISWVRACVRAPMHARALCASRQARCCRRTCPLAAWLSCALTPRAPFRALLS